ncbi:probable glutamate receptor, partial [Limulus polyphemus]|uniref:Probable glutamate receptor n=1 Tax=Limulus polyphemus TaxID=6850 RepID=A0ABM1BLH1_LIMPO
MQKHNGYKARGRPTRRWSQDNIDNIKHHGISLRYTTDTGQEKDQDEGGVKTTLNTMESAVEKLWIEYIKSPYIVPLHLPVDRGSNYNELTYHNHTQVFSTIEHQQATETTDQQTINYIIEGPDIESCNCTKRVRIGRWIAQNQKLQPAKPNDFFRLSGDLHIINRTLRVATMDNFPFFVQEIISDRKVIGKDGIDLKIIEILAEKFNFKFQILTPSDRVWGVKLPDGEWSGLFRMILKQEADFAITNIGMINERQEAIDYTYPYMTDSLNFLVRGPREKSRALAVIRPFTLEVWIGLLVVVLLTSLFTTFVAKTTCNPNAQKWSFRQALWYYFGALTSQGGAQNLPSTNSLRLIVTFYWFFAMITVAGFSGSLTSYMNIPEKESPIDTISELVKRMENGQIKVGTLHGALPYANFMSATEGDMYRIGKEIKRDQEGTLVKDIKTGAFRTMQESYALVFPRSFVEGTLVSMGIKDYHFGREQFYINFFSIAVPKGSPMKDAFSKVLKRLNEMGLISKWYKDVLSRRERQKIFSKMTSHDNTTTPIPPLNKEEQKGPRPLQLEDLQGAYIVFFVGLISALLVFLLELRL